MLEMINVGVFGGGIFALLSVLVSHSNQSRDFDKKWLDTVAKKMEEFGVLSRKISVDFYISNPSREEMGYKISEVLYSLDALEVWLGKEDEFSKEVLSEGRKVMGAFQGAFKAKYDTGEDLSGYIESASKAMSGFDESSHRLIKRCWKELKDGGSLIKWSYFLLGGVVGCIILVALGGVFEFV